MFSPISGGGNKLLIHLKPNKIGRETIIKYKKLSITKNSFLFFIKNSKTKKNNGAKIVKTNNNSRRLFLLSTVVITNKIITKIRYLVKHQSIDLFLGINYIIQYKLLFERSLELAQEYCVETMSPKNIGEYKHYDYCRFCFSKHVELVVDLGNMPLAGGFLKNNDKETLEKEKYYPLELIFCKNCYLLQTNNVVNKDLLFKEYFYCSSAIQTLVDYFETNVADIKNKYPDSSKRFIVEIGCNDGAFIMSLIKNGYKALGIDPAENIVTPLIGKGMPIINEYFSEKIAKEIQKDYGKADAIYSFNTLAHIEDMHDVVRGIKLFLKRDGILVFQVHYLGNLVKETQYDMIYHEHQYYYSLLTLQKFFTRYNMEIFDIKFVELHGGSIMYYVQNKNTGTNAISENVNRLLKKERIQGLDNPKTFSLVGKKILRHKKTLLELLINLKRKRMKIVGYGASGRATIIMNYCEIDGKYLDYVVDDSPAKQNLYTPGTHLKINSSSKFINNHKPDYILLFAWSFINEIKNKNIHYLKYKGKFIIPLPKVEVVSV